MNEKKISVSARKLGECDYVGQVDGRPVAGAYRDTYDGARRSAVRIALQELGAAMAYGGSERIDRIDIAWLPETQ